MRTEMTLTLLREYLLSNCGDIHGACRSAGVSPLFVQQWRKDDKEVDDTLLEATRVGAMALESEAIRRAVNGVEVGVYHRGVLVAKEVKHSDALLTTLMKARVPGYGNDNDGGGVNHFHGPTQINVMPRATTIDEWLVMRKAMDTRDDDVLALPEPDAAIDEADFTPVEPSFVGLGL